METPRKTTTVQRRANYITHRYLNTRMKPFSEQATKSQINNAILGNM